MGCVVVEVQAQAPVGKDLSITRIFPCEVLVPTVPSSIIDPIWDQFAALIPEPIDSHPLGCHRPRISERIIFDKLVQVLVLGASYEKVADATCPATTIRNRRDEWINAEIMETLEQLCLDSYDRMFGLALEEISVDGYIVKAPCGGEAAGPSPVDRGKQGTKRSVVTAGSGVPIGCVTAGANRPDSPLLRPTLVSLGRFEIRFGIGLPEHITVNLDAGYDSQRRRELLDELDCQAQISAKGTPLQTGPRWPVERINSWHNRGFKKLATCTEVRTRVINAFIALANVISITRRLIRMTWTTHRWDDRPARRP